jgi:hypothetical protein
MKKVVLAYSGGLDTSVAVAWLREKYDCEVVCLTVDVGGGSLRPGVEKRAISAGASRAYVVDARERFVRDFVWPHLQANAMYQGGVDVVYAAAGGSGRPELRSLFDGLPVAGYSGTLVHRFSDRLTAAGAGVVRAKTGTLRGVNTLAGITVDADGRLLAFAFMADHRTVTLGSAADLVDRAASTLAACGCR